MIDWTPADSDKLRTYLFETNSKLLHALREGAPKQIGKSFEEVALMAKENLGWNNCIDTIERNSVAVNRPQESTEFVDVTKGLPR